jgi:hypothetical protein
MALLCTKFVLILTILICIVATSKARNLLTLQGENELSLENTLLSPAVLKALKVLPSPTNKAPGTPNKKNIFDAYSKAGRQIESSRPSCGIGHREDCPPYL